MRFINLLINESVLKAEIALQRSTSEELVDECRNYLAALREYRDQLIGLRGLPELNVQPGTSLARELIDQARSAVRSALEITVRETNRTEALLNSFTSINVHQAAETFNLLSYRGVTNWEASSSGVRSSNTSGFDQLSVQDAVDTASRLRRDAYVAVNKIVAGASISKTAFE